MYNQNQSQPMQNQGNMNMNPKFMMPSQPPQNMMMFGQGMNRVGMVPKPELPLHLQVLFAPRMPLVYVKPPEKHKCRSFDPIIKPDFDFISKFEDEDPPEREEIESKAEKKSKMLKQKLEDYKNKIKEGIKQWNPTEDPKCTGDPMKTLFIARVSFETSEKKLRKEFEVYGPIKKVRLIKNITNNKPRGYAFIEFEHKKDFITAYKQADGKKIDDRRVLVDCERGRTVKGWRPRRFGGGKGETRRARSAHKERTDKKKSKSRSRDNNNKKRRSRSESNKHRSRSRERSRERKNFGRERDREPPRGGDRDRGDRNKDRERERRDFNKDTRNDFVDKDRDRKEREKEREKRNPRAEKEPVRKEKKELPNKMEDEGELLSGEIEKKKKKKKGKEKDRSREKKRSKSPKEKKHRRSGDRKNDDDRMKMEIENQNAPNDKKEMGEIRSDDI